MGPASTSNAGRSFKGEGIGLYSPIARLLEVAGLGPAHLACPTVQAASMPAVGGRLWRSGSTAISTLCVGFARLFVRIVYATAWCASRCCAHLMNNHDHDCAQYCLRFNDAPGTAVLPAGARSARLVLGDWSGAWL